MFDIQYVYVHRSPNCSHGQWSFSLLTTLDKVQGPQDAIEAPSICKYLFLLSQCIDCTQHSQLLVLW